MKDLVIVGGSAAGLAATLTAARSLLKVVCIDTHTPCNRFADHSHNFLSRDGERPSKILSEAIQQIKKYPTVNLIDGRVESVTPTDDNLFKIVYDSENKKTIIHTKKVLFASGIKDKIEEVQIKNFALYWGKTVIHCPYCHGFENANTKTALLYPNLQLAGKMAIKIFNWSNDMVILTNGIVGENETEVRQQFSNRNIEVIDLPIDAVEGSNGQLEKIVFKDETSIQVSTLYTIPPYEVNNISILKKLGLEFNELNLVKADNFGRTNVPGIYVAGDMTSLARSLSISSTAGLLASIFIGDELFEENWNSLLK